MLTLIYVCNSVLNGRRREDKYKFLPLLQSDAVGRLRLFAQDLQ